jgi:hypothetical protein
MIAAWKAKVWKIKEVRVVALPPLVESLKTMFLSALEMILSGVRLLCQRFDTLGLCRTHCF